MLDDDIDTIQLVGTSLNKTYVTGQVLSSLQDADQRHDPVQPPLECRRGGFGHPQRLHAGADGCPARRELEQHQHGHLPRRAESGPSSSTTSRRRSTWRRATCRSISSSATQSPSRAEDPPRQHLQHRDQHGLGEHPHRSPGDIRRSTLSSTARSEPRLDLVDTAPHQCGVAVCLPDGRDDGADGDPAHGIDRLKVLRLGQEPDGVAQHGRPSATA